MYIPKPSPKKSPFISQAPRTNTAARTTGDLDGNGNTPGKKRSSDGRPEGISVQDSKSSAGENVAKPQRIPVEIIDTRNIIPNPDEINHRNIWFTPKTSGPITLCLEATGINSSDRIEVQSSSVGKFSETARLAWVSLDNGRRLRKSERLGHKPAISKPIYS